MLDTEAEAVVGIQIVSATDPRVTGASQDWQDHKLNDFEPLQRSVLTGS